MLQNTFNVTFNGNGTVEHRKLMSNCVELCRSVPIRADSYRSVPIGVDLCRSVQNDDKQCQTVPNSGKQPQIYSII